MHIEHTGRRFIVTHENELEITVLQGLLNSLHSFFEEFNEAVKTQQRNAMFDIMFEADQSARRDEHHETVQ